MRSGLLQTIKSAHLVLHGEEMQRLALHCVEVARTSGCDGLTVEPQRTCELRETPLSDADPHLGAVPALDATRRLWRMDTTDQLVNVKERLRRERGQQ